MQAWWHRLEFLIDHLPLPSPRRLLFNLLNLLLSNDFCDAGVDLAADDLPSTMRPGKEPDNLLYQASIEIRAGFPLLVFDP